MKSKLRLSVHLMLNILFYSIFFVNHRIFASTYGSGTYGGGSGSQNCSYDQAWAQQSRSFFSRYGWMIFLGLIILSLILFLLLRRKRKKEEAKPKKNLPPNNL